MLGLSFYISVFILFDFIRTSFSKITEIKSQKIRLET